MIFIVNNYFYSISKFIDNFDMQTVSYIIFSFIVFTWLIIAVVNLFPFAYKLMLKIFKTESNFYRFVCRYSLIPSGIIMVFLFIYFGFTQS